MHGLAGIEILPGTRWEWSMHRSEGVQWHHWVLPVPGTWYRLKTDTRSQSTHIFGVYRYQVAGTCIHTVVMLKPCALRMYPLRYLTDTRHNAGTCTEYHKNKINFGYRYTPIPAYCIYIMYSYIVWLPFPVCIFGQIFAIFGLSRNSRYLALSYVAMCTQPCFSYRYQVVVWFGGRLGWWSTS